MPITSIHDKEYLPYDRLNVSSWIVKINAILKDDDVLAFLIRNALTGDLRGDLTIKLVEKYPHLKDQVLNELYP